MVYLLVPCSSFKASSSSQSNPTSGENAPTITYPELIKLKNSIVKRTLKVFYDFTPEKRENALKDKDGFKRVIVHLLNKKNVNTDFEIKYVTEFAIYALEKEALSVLSHLSEEEILKKQCFEKKDGNDIAEENIWLNSIAAARSEYVEYTRGKNIPDDVSNALWEGWYNETKKDQAKRELFLVRNFNGYLSKKTPFRQILLILEELTLEEDLHRDVILGRLREYLKNHFES